VVPTGCQNKGTCLSCVFELWGMSTEIKKPGVIQTDILYRCKILDVALTGYF
jgi:hypothetical protein